MKKKTALIFGITGQDGIHLTNFLLNNKKVDSILGISRSPDSTKFLQNLNYLNNSLDTKKVSLNKSNLYNEKEVSNIITDYNPDFIFNLSLLLCNSGKVLFDNSLSGTHETIVLMFKFCRSFKSSVDNAALK
mgnify:CR=1 FL=1